ncbi:MAG: lipocalin family protein [Thermomonas sp.]
MRWALAALLLALAADAGASRPPIPPVPQVDLPRFMGTWYLVGGIPTPFEREAWNAVETYTLRRDGSILTTLTFNHGAANGPRKHIEAPARVRPDTGNAVWDVRVFGPVKAQYIVAWLREDYGLMLVARDARDYAWVFARSPAVPEAELEAARRRLQGWGYDLGNWRRIPHVVAHSAQ